MVAAGAEQWQGPSSSSGRRCPILNDAGAPPLSHGEGLLTGSGNSKRQSWRG